MEICEECYGKIPFTRDTEIPFALGCYYDELICVCRYLGIIKDAVIKFKFFNKPYYYRAFGALMSQKIKKVTSMPDFDIIICVPLHSKKCKERGYNQAELISRALSRELSVPANFSLLTRIRNTKPQSLLPGDKRYQNVKDAFCVIEKDRIKGKKVMIVDDVLTTGNTLNECARVLKEAGAKWVTAVVIASGRNY
jgi:competence protein ComFC